MFFRQINTKSVNGNNPLGLTGSEILECFLYGLSAAVAVGFLVMVYGVYQYSHSNHTFAVQFEYKNESYSFLTKDAHSCDDLAKSVQKCRIFDVEEDSHAIEKALGYHGNNNMPVHAN